ncbi:aquaporin-1 [Austrofundulus limnaeus]|uniref:Aquaporin-1 n=1 Tax=Austrofundulus limnaeus TaxID=52670 RepID=A0A2I4CXZ7_AUSLI|nr:PREDICTED: aquaporin-1-like [Austrofundulus limnaeus]
MLEIKLWAFWRAVLAECLGVIFFVFTGLSAAIGSHNNSFPDQELKVAFAFGLAAATLTQCTRHVSGAHLNPAVTLGLLATCQISFLRAFFYMLAQMLGAVAGSAIVYGVRPANTDSLGVNKLNGITPGQGFGFEFLLSLQLVLCVLTVSDKRRNVGQYAPLAYGLSVAAGHLAGIRYTGCGINPARSFGPALILLSFDDHWVYWAGPMSAGVVAALLYNYLLAPREERFSEQARALLCCGWEDDEEEEEGTTTEPLVGEAKDAE